MKILTLFTDMIRPNRFKLYNDEIKVNTPLDKFLNDFGGTHYTNCYTSGPDTPRSISSFLTGIIPSDNGCNTRLKWPMHFLNDEYITIFDLFEDNNYKISSFTSIQERNSGIFPKKILEKDIHNENNYIERFLEEIILEDNHFVFISVPDFHWSFDDAGYNKKGEEKSLNIFQITLNLIFKKFKKDDFDHIFIFSDHGFKFSYQLKLENKLLFLNNDRTNCLLIHRKENEDLNFNNKLCNIIDFFPTFQKLIGLPSNGKYFFSEHSHNYIIIEDHLEFTPSVNQNIEIWALVTLEYTYIRTLTQAVIYNHKNKQYTFNNNNSYDEILIKESSFGFYFSEYNKLFTYKSQIRVPTEHFTNGIIRKKSLFVNKIFTARDFISKFL